MSPERLLAHFHRLAEAPDAVARLRRLILDLAVRGKLAEQNSADEPAAAFLKRIKAEKERLVLNRLAKKAKPIPPPSGDAMPFPIPQSWRWSQLAEIGFINPRNSADDKLPVSFVPMTLISAEYGVQSNWEVRPWGEIKSGFTHFADGDVALAKITPCFQNGKSAAFRGLTGAIGAGTTELHVVRPLFSDPDYVLIFLKCPFFIETGVPKMTGTAGQKRVSTEYFAYSPFPLPPVAEQRRIVAKVDELMALCDRLEAAQRDRETRRDRLGAASLARLRHPADAAAFRRHARFHLDHLPRLTTRPEHIPQLRQTILNFAVRGKLVPQNSSDEPTEQLVARVAAEKSRLLQTKVIKSESPSDPISDKEALFSIPDAWIWLRACELCRQISSGSTPDQSVFHNSEGIPYLKVYNIRNQIVDFDYRRQFIDVDHHEQRMKRSRLLPGDVLMNIVGPPLGKVAIVPTTFAEWNCNQAIAFFRPVFPEFAPYIYMFLKEGSFLRNIELIGTAGQDNISVTKCKFIPIPLPPLAEQRRIVAKVAELMSLCDRLEAQLTAAQTASRRLLEAVLHEALAEPPPG